MEHHSFGFGELVEMLCGDVVLALAFAELNHGDLLPPGEFLQGRHERLADRIHEGTGGELVAAMESKEAGHSLLPL